MPKKASQPSVKPRIATSQTSNAKVSKRGGDKSNYTKAMMKPADTSKGATPALPTPKNRGRPKSNLPAKKIPSGMHQTYIEVPKHMLTNKIDY